MLCGTLCIHLEHRIQLQRRIHFQDTLHLKRTSKGTSRHHLQHRMYRIFIRMHRRYRRAARCFTHGTLDVSLIPPNWRCWSAGKRTTVLDRRSCSRIRHHLGIRHRLVVQVASFRCPLVAILVQVLMRLALVAMIGVASRSPLPHVATIYLADISLQQ